MTGRAPRAPLGWLGALLVLYLLIPLAAFAIRLAGSHDRGFGTPGLWDAARISALSATISTMLIVSFGVPLASWLARSRGRLGTVVGLIVQLPLALPPLMSGIILIYVVGPYTRVGQLFDGRLTDSIAGIVLAQSFVAAPFLVISARSAFESVDPALDDLAATLGHRPLARFTRVDIPIAWPGIRAGMLLTWLRAFGEYGATVLLAYHPYSLPVYTYVQFSGYGIPTTQAPTAIALGIAVVVVLISRIRRFGRRRPQAVLPEPMEPRPAPPTQVTFDLDLHVGSFHLEIAHAAQSHRVAILGPSGAGKSIALRAIAGLLGSRAGAVTYAGQAVADTATEARQVGYLPQTHGLFPGRTVWQQLLFATEADPNAASWWIHTLQLDGLQDRLPEQLSGGQRQRVSLAQALSHRPRLVLLDEPFSALDAPVRDELRRELRRLQHETGLSTLLVTHDPEEAALLADEIIVIDEGRILQAGPRAQVYNRPASPQVARLLGIQNLHPGVVTAGGEVRSGAAPVAAYTAGMPSGTHVLWSVRPEHVRITPDGAYPATIVDVADIGTSYALIVRLDGGPELRVRTIESIALRAGDACHLALAPNDLTVWPAPDEPAAG
ncbi:ATP-binding cassette domain-containing protein [Leekyejoonella antrihumi]|uniref:ATP-binding cassette domain-containing protein n=1 Tax=Leekyejoonella antrihumi TaxID=1660198 RepID=A0A563DXN0_9MICO|nr:ATP-binding cassette domain-containing protein [Leekyejoonella antrihumi]TWP34965.1 ATP-binding cassette domain-containing protein [Leekyejoonella antrihumi]